jgi:hypothetical protein
MILVAGVLLAAGGRLALNPVARHFSQRALDSIAGYHGNFDAVAISLLHLRYQIDNLNLARDPGLGHAETLHVQQLEARLQWSDLWRFHLAGVLRVDEAKVTYVIESRAQLQAALHSAEALADLPDLGGKLEALVPFRITRIEVRRSEALVVDRTEKGVPDKSRELWLHEIEATLENLGSRSALLQGEPATLALEAKLQRSGDLSVFMTMDPLAYKLDLEGELSVRHLQLDELYGFVLGLAELKTRQGMLDAFATFRCQEGFLSGAFKPILSNVELTPTQHTVGNDLLATTANAAIGLASAGAPGHEVATVIPFDGRVTDPEAHIGPALLALLGGPTARQASKSFAALPVGSKESDPRPNDEAKAKHRAPERPALSTSPQGLFKRGAVPKIQAALSAHGFATPATGTLAGPTQRELHGFQDQQNLPGTGFPDRVTLSRLGLAGDALYHSNRD